MLVVDASRVSNRLGLMRKAGVTEYVVRTSDGQEHVVMLEDPPAPTNTVEGTPTTTTTTATPAPAPAPAAAPATNTAPASTNNNNNNGGGGGGTSVNVQQAKVPTGGELFMMYLPFIILLLVLLITCALCYLFRDRLPTCVHYIEVRHCVIASTDCHYPGPLLPCFSLSLCEGSTSNECLECDVDYFCC